MLRVVGPAVRQHRWFVDVRHMWSHPESQYGLADAGQHVLGAQLLSHPRGIGLIKILQHLPLGPALCPALFLALFLARTLAQRNS